MLMGVETGCDYIAHCILYFCLYLEIFIIIIINVFACNVYHRHFDNCKIQRSGG